MILVGLNKGSYLYFNANNHPVLNMLDMQCNEADKPVEPINAVIDSLFIVLVVIVTIPQYYKLHTNRSSAGLSLITVIFTVGLNATNVAAGIITKWRQLEKCSDGWSCYPGIVDLLQLMTLLLTTGGVLVQAIAYKPYAGFAPRVTAAGTLLLSVGACASSAIVSAYDPCSTVALSIAEGFGWSAAFFAVVQYLPQMLETLKHKSSGSLSVTMYLVQVGMTGPLFASPVLRLAHSSCLCESRAWHGRRV